MKPPTPLWYIENEAVEDEFVSAYRLAQVGLDVGDVKVGHFLEECQQGDTANDYQLDYLPNHVWEVMKVHADGACEVELWWEGLAEQRKQVKEPDCPCSSKQLAWFGHEDGCPWSSGGRSR